MSWKPIIPHTSFRHPESRSPGDIISKQIPGICCMRTCFPRCCWMRPPMQWHVSMLPRAAPCLRMHYVIDLPSSSNGYYAVGRGYGSMANRPNTVLHRQLRVRNMRSPNCVDERSSPALGAVVITNNIPKHMQVTERIAKNNAYYDLFASEVAARSQARDFSRAFDAFTERLHQGAVLLDIGCGTGEHLDWFAAHGFTAIGVEPSARMREIAREKGHTVVDGTFESLAALNLPAANGIWCAASLLHVPLEEVDTVLASLRNQCLDGAVFYATVRLGEGAKWDRWDDEHSDAERLIQLFSEEDLLARVKRARFVMEDSWVEDSTWGRPSKWISFIARTA